MRSRTRKKIRNQNLIFVIIIIFIISVLILFGTQILIGLSIAIDKLKDGDTINIESKNIVYIAPPVIDPLSEVTRENTVNITGSVLEENSQIKLYVNDKFVDDASPNDQQEFSFTNVKLKEGINIIKAKTLLSNGTESAYSQSIRIKYLNKNPTLEIYSPQDGQIYKKDQSPIRISGKTDAGAKVTVNDFWAISDNKGEFYYIYPLKDGMNNLKIKSTDEAGNESLKEITINIE